MTDELRFSPRPNRAREIRWRSWGDPVFREAQEKGRPILLSISAVWCHWCHVMDETAYSDRRIIEQINARFIPVRVDNDRRPDVNRRYNMGGWPSTVFLTETGDVITGATYLPPANMLEALRRVDEVYAAQRIELVQKGAQQRATALSQLRAAIKAEDAARHAERALQAEAAGVVRPEGQAASADEAASGPRSPLPDTLAAEREEDAWTGPLVDEIQQAALEAFDPGHGGFGTEPKFPHADVLELLLLRAAGCADARLDEVITTTLDRMADGDMYDRAEDGFFRYATKRNWSEPHYEKMLEDNAKLALVYLNAASVYGRDRPIKPPDVTEAQTEGHTAGGAGGDAAAADSGRAAHYKDVAAGVLRYMNDVLWLPESNAFAGSQDADEEYYSLDLDARRERTAPLVDKSVYANWNALAARALLRAALVLDRPELSEQGTSLLDGLWERGHGRRGVGHFLDPAGKPGEVDGLLGDQATIAAALLDAYESSGDRTYLARAEVLSDWVDEHLSAPGGGLFDRARGLESAGLLAVPMVSFDEAAVMADVWMRLAAYCGEGRYRARVSRLFVAMRNLAARMGMMAAPYASALLRAVEPQVHIVVAGPREDPATLALHKAALAVSAPQRTVQVLDPRTDAEHMVRDGFSLEGQSEAYVCLGSNCLPPTTDPGQVNLLARGLGEEREAD